MDSPTLEERITVLEAELAALKKRIEVQEPRHGWRKTVGTFANDPVFDDIVRLGQEYRRSQHRDGPLRHACQ